METIALPTSQPSLDSLNESCLLKLLAFLDIDDHISLSGTCVYLKKVVDSMFKKCCKFELDRTIVKKGEKYVDRVLNRIGRHVTSLTIQCTCRFNNYPCSRVINWIDGNNLTSLRIEDLSKACQSDMLLHSFTNVEVLTLKSCFSSYEKKILYKLCQKLAQIKITQHLLCTH